LDGRANTYAHCDLHGDCDVDTNVHADVHTYTDIYSYRHSNAVPAAEYGATRPG
jgi:hypothetical protein